MRLVRALSAKLAVVVGLTPSRAARLRQAFPVTQSAHRAVLRPRDPPRLFRRPLHPANDGHIPLVRHLLYSTPSSSPSIPVPPTSVPGRLVLPGPSITSSALQISPLPSTSYSRPRSPNASPLAVVLRALPPDARPSPKITVSESEGDGWPPTLARGIFRPTPGKPIMRSSPQ